MSEIDALVALANKNNDFTELRARMLNRIEFGTAGLRAKMCAGFGRMNDLVIIQTTQGLAAYLLELHSKHLENTQPPLVVVGFDTRHNSQKFALCIDMFPHMQYCQHYFYLVVLGI